MPLAARRALPWLALLPFAAWLAVRGSGWDRGLLVMLVAFTPYVAAAAVLPVVLAAALRAWWPTAAAVAVAVGLAGLVVPRAVAADPPADGRALRVATANMWHGRASVADLAALVAARDVDVLALQEFTPDTARRMRDVGLADRLPHQVSEAIPGTGGSAVYSRHPLRDTGVRRNAGGFHQAYGTVLPPGGPPVDVESVHPLAPSGVGALAAWAADLRAQPPATPEGPLRVLAGDFNATLDHHLLRRLLDSGYRDAADATGRGLRGTWGPYDGDPIPPVTIDHVLADRRVGVRAYGVQPIAVGDHRAVWAELVLPA
ncbi:MAG TPA: endonuclease/exonuclease/phosphatase family protein [Pilimelia sp.]|nr:endonuclease/exonuclease/phosphatase family protein [Pilimelia sp.]